MENIKSSADFVRRKQPGINLNPRIVDGFLSNGNFRAHFTCSGKEDDIKLVETILNYIRQNQYCTGSIRDYRKTITSRDQCVRDAIDRCNIVIGIVTSDFKMDDMCLYEIALSVQAEKHVILVLFEKVELPDIFEKLEFIDTTSKLNDWKDLLKKKISSHANDQVDIVNIGKFVSSLQRKLFPQEVREVLLEQKLENYRRTIQELNDKILNLEKRQDKNPCAEPVAKEQIMKDVGPRYENVAEVAAALCVGTKKFQRKKGLLNLRRKKKIKDISKRYSMQFSLPQIRTFGRNLDLDSDEMESIEKYREHGSTEMFWETVRVWMSKNTKEYSIRTLLKAIEDTGIDLKGRGMSEEDKRLLQSMATNLSDEMHSVDLLMPNFLKHGLVCAHTRHYIEAGKNRVQKILRLIEILETNEYGYSLLIKCLSEGGHGFLAETLQDEYDKIKVTLRTVPGRKKKPTLKVPPSHRSSDSPASTESTISSQELASIMRSRCNLSLSSEEHVPTSRPHSNEDDSQQSIDVGSKSILQVHDNQAMNVVY